MGHTANYGQVSVTTSAVQVLDRTADLRDRVVLTNHSTTDIYISNSDDVSSNNGILMPGVAGYQLILYNRDPIWAIAASGTVKLGYCEEVK